MTTQRTWVVTGTSRGLGRRLAEAVLKAGDNLVATARDKTLLNDLVVKYESRIRAISLDVTDVDCAREALHAAVHSFGRLDVLVNNAGYADVASVEDMTDEAFRAQIEVNFFGVVQLTKAALPIMRAQGSGHIIQISSVGGRVGGAGLGAYQAAKWAVTGFSEVLAKEVSRFGIKVTVAEPGGMRTNWAGSSMATLHTSDAYRPVIEPVIARLRGADGNQPGNPERVAQVLIDVVAMKNPPLRLLLGQDAIAVAQRVAENLAESDARWQFLSESISYPA